MKDFKNMLIVRTDRIGDVVLTTPAISALRKFSPDARISILVSPAAKSLVDGNSDIDEIIVDDRKGDHRGFKGFVKLIGIIRKKKFDLAIVYHTKKRTNALCFLSGIPYRLGFKNNKLGFLLNHPLQDDRHEGKKHEAQYCLDVLKDIGISSDDLSLCVNTDEKSNEWRDRYLKEGGIGPGECLIAVHPGASDPSKMWPEKRFAQLIDMIFANFTCHILLIGSKEIQGTSESIIRLCKSAKAHTQNLHDLSGKTDIGQMISLLKKCSLLVSNDSGPVHVAAGVGTPVISIFTRNQPGINPARWRPLSQQSKVISVPLDHNDNFQKAGSADQKYLELIEAKEVFEAVDAIFKL